MLVHHKDLVSRGGTGATDEPLIQTAETRPGWLDVQISPSELGPANLQRREFADAQRWLIPDPSKAFVDVVFGELYQGRTIKVVGGIGHTLSFGGKYRITIASSATSAADALRSKIYLVALSGGIISDAGFSHPPITTDYNLDPDYATVTETLPQLSPADDVTDVHVAFEDPGASLLTGAGIQQFRLRLGLLDIWGDGVADPGDAADVDIQLWENGGLVESLGVFELTAGVGDGGQVVSAFWDASLLADVTGADVELRVICTTTAGTKYGNIMGLRWYAELAGAAYESGWVDAYPTTFVDPEDWPFARQFAHVIPDGYTLTEDFDVVTVRLYDPWNVAGWLDLSRLMIGDAFQPPKSFSLRQPITIEDVSPVDVSRSGEEFFDIGPSRRVWPFESRALTRDDAHQVLHQVLGRVGTTGEVLIIPDENNQEVAPYEAIYGRLRSSSVTPVVGKRLWESRFEIQEANVRDGSLQLYASAATIAALASEASEALMTEAGEVITL